ncbi:hypothetical protein ACQ4PT_017002 [Festuca glaucescens]
MASPPRPLLGLSLAVLLHLSPLLASAALVMEDGYTVSTAADLNPRPPSTGAQPYALLPRPRAGDLLLLDSTGSVLYTLALPVSADGEPRRLAGGAGTFGRPRSVAVDGADNVYVADREHGAIRKVAPSGESARPAFLPVPFVGSFVLGFRVCSMGTSRVRNGCDRLTGTSRVTAAINAHVGTLCACRFSGHQSGIFTPSMQEVSINRFFSRVQKQFKRTQRKATLISFSDIRSAIANSMLYALLLKLIRVSCGYLTVVLPSIRLERGVPCKPFPSLDLDKAGTAPSLLDLDQSGTTTTTTTTTGLPNKALPSTEHLGDFIGFDGDSDTDEGNESAFDDSFNTQEENKEASLDRDLWTLFDNKGSSKKIDNMIESNLLDFSGQDKYGSSGVKYSGVSRRRSHGDSKVL